MYVGARCAEYVERNLRTSTCQPKEFIEMDYAKLFPNDFVQIRILVLLDAMSNLLNDELHEFKAKSEQEMLGFLILGLLQNLEMVSVHRGENCKAWIITTEGEAAIEHLIENTNDDDDDNCDAVATPAAA
jgi:hypothetical protein